jgi:sugar/nucleoside kinase (ribokinase family)
VTVIKANAGELRQLFGGADLRATVRAAASVCPIVVGTNGAAGVYAAAEGKLYRAGVYRKAKVVDRTGAGDAFGSGFVAALSRDRGIEDALTLGSANATGVVGAIGAKQGIISVRRPKRMKVEVEEL